MSFFDALRYASKELEQEAKREQYKTDIRLWAKDKLGYTLWNKQVEIADALLKYRRVAVKSGHGVGKSFIASVILAWWVDTRQNMDSVALSTAPVQPQLGIIWGYVKDHHTNGKLFGRITMENDWYSDTNVHRAYGRKPADNNAHAFQGVHRRQGVLAVVDEGCGVPETIFTAVDAITTGRHDAALVIGNPDDIDTPFGRIWSQDMTSWHKITISSLDSPNVTGEDFPEEASGGLVTPEWIEERKREWGEDSARYRSKVLGEFTEDGTGNKLFTQLALARAIGNDLLPSDESRPVLGVDVARFGGDYTTVYSYQEGQLRLVDKWQKADTVESSKKIHEWAIRLAVTEVRVDSIGIGAGVYDQLKVLADNEYHIIGMAGNGESPDINKWANSRAYWFDTLREKMFTHRIDMEYEDFTLKSELEGIQYKFSKRGGIQIESKDEMRKRGVKSPDFADAAAYACADLGIDPTDPTAHLLPGDNFMVSIEEALYGMEIEVSPF